MTEPCSTVEVPLLESNHRGIETQQVARRLSQILSLESNHRGIETGQAD